MRALCGCCDLQRLRDAVERVRAYEWGDADRAVVFGAISACAGCGTPASRESLIGLATRAGFPDLELETYFDGNGASVEEAVEKLLAAR